MTERPLTSGQVADLFGVDVNTVGAWAAKGQLPHFKTPGGHLRFRRSDLDRLLPDAPAADSEPAA